MQVAHREKRNEDGESNENLQNELKQLSDVVERLESRLDEADHRVITFIAEQKETKAMVRELMSDQSDSQQVLQLMTEKNQALQKKQDDMERKLLIEQRRKGFIARNSISKRDKLRDSNNDSFDNSMIDKTPHGT